MAVAAFKSWSSGEVLTAADLNSSFTQVFDNGEDLGWPATKAKDLNGNELILDADGDTSITADTDDQIDIKIAGNDDFRFTANTFAVNGNELILDADGDTSITADTDDQIDVKIAGNDDFRFTANQMRAESGSAIVQVDGIMAIGASTTDANMTLGLLIDQAGNDDAAVGLKSSDVAHGMTTLAETDTYGTLGKLNATLGGMEIVGYGEGTQAFQLLGRVTTADEAKNSTANAPFQMRAEIKSGTSAVVMGANDNIMLVTGGVNGVVFIIDAEGDLFADGGTSTTNMVTKFDAYDDASIVGDFNEFLGTGAAPDFARMGELAGLGLIGRTSEEEWEAGVRPLWSITKLAQLHNGWMVQASVRERILWGVLASVVPGFRNAVEGLALGQNVGAIPLEQR